jgi:hypothetical protein
MSRYSNIPAHPTNPGLAIPHMIWNGPLSPDGASSLKDFKLHLVFLGTDVLDERAFNALLDNIGYRRSREGLWDSFLAEVAAVKSNGGEAKDGDQSITVADMAKLYASDTYHTLRIGKDSGDALMEYVDQRKYDGSVVSCL